MNWRVYRLPGSRNVWHVDSGPNTVVINVVGYRAAETHSVDIGDGWPRAWIALDNQELHIVNGIAIFTVADKMENPVMACCGKMIDLGKENC